MSNKNKPVVFSDLDDTLFQTRRKMEGWAEPHQTAASDREQNPRSYMSLEQSMFVDWLLEYSDLIPVTARGTQEIARVHIPFRSWQVTTHGAVILNIDGSENEAWRAHILKEIEPYKKRLIEYRHFIEQLMAERNLNAWARINYEYDDCPIYFVMKHRDSAKIDELYAFADELEDMLSTDGFYIHRNDNNIAWLPNPIEKRKAVTWLLDELRTHRGVFPVIALGDSLSDYSFMEACSWFALPRRGQLAEAINIKIFGAIQNGDN